VTPEERIEQVLLKKTRVARQTKSSAEEGTPYWLSMESEIQSIQIKLGEIDSYTPEVKEWRKNNLIPQTLSDSLIRDQAMGQSMFGMLAPSGVRLGSGTGLRAGETRITDQSEITVSSEATWYDNVVGVERAKRAPTIPVVYDNLGLEMGDVWKAIEEASSAYRQASWTHNPTLLKDMRSNLKKRRVADISQAITNVSLGLEVTDEGKASIPDFRSQWLEAHAGEIESAVRMASDQPEEQSLEDLFNIAYWMGCEMQMIDDQVDSPETTGDYPMPEDSDEPVDEEENNEGESGENPEGDFDQGQDDQDQDDQDQDGQGEGEDSDSDDDSTDNDSTDSDSSESDSDGSGSSDSQGEDDEEESRDGSGSSETDDSQDESSGEEPSPEGSQGEDSDGSQEVDEQVGGKQGSLGSGSDRDKGKETLEQMNDAVSSVQEVKPNESDSFNAVHPDERWILIEAETTDLKPHTNVQLAMEDFVGNEDFKESHFGDPDADMLHELRLGNMDVFEIEAETQGRVVVMVDCSSSMDCSCDYGYSSGRIRSRKTENAANGWLAWQVAGAIHRQFPDAEVFGYSSGSGTGSDKIVRSGSKNHRVLDRSPDWFNGAPDKSATYKPGGLEHSRFGAAGDAQMERKWDTNMHGHDATRVAQVMTPGHRLACEVHGQADRLLGGGTPESGALSYLVKRLDAAFETSVGILITDGEPNNSARSYAMTRRMHKAGMRFGVISINHKDTGIYPASMLHHIDKAADLKKLPAIFDFITGGSK